MPYTVTVRGEFCAAMQLPNIDGPCAQLHGHTYQIGLTVSATQLDDNGVVCDYFALKQALDGYLATLDYEHLNTLPVFAGQAPSAERLAQLIFQHFKAKVWPQPLTIASVTIQERGFCEISYSETT